MLFRSIPFRVDSMRVSTRKRVWTHFAENRVWSLSPANRGMWIVNSALSRLFKAFTKSTGIVDGKQPRVNRHFLKNFALNKHFHALALNSLNCENESSRLLSIRRQFQVGMNFRTTLTPSSFEVNSGYFAECIDLSPIKFLGIEWWHFYLAFVLFCFFLLFCFW